MITVRKQQRTGAFKIYSTDPFFKINKIIVFESDEYGFSFRVPSIDDTEYNTASSNGVNGFVLTVRSEMLIDGIYEVDQEESNEDELMVNY
tara:strand:+ start:695 stop:967 length:273 start_codon:yes stop_codon:yes gene_type:complete